uniref:Uncharacterized protein n=1 Tax=Arundo donax TaxID=35708 RepID=A0A0A8Y601_ARUDO
MFKGLIMRYLKFFPHCLGYKQS